MTARVRIQYNPWYLNGEATGEVRLIVRYKNKDIWNEDL